MEFLETRESTPIQLLHKDSRKVSLQTYATSEISFRSKSSPPWQDSKVSRSHSRREKLKDPKEEETKNNKNGNHMSAFLSRKGRKR